MEEKVDEFGKDSAECVEVLSYALSGTDVTYHATQSLRSCCWQAYLKFATACIAWHNNTASPDNASSVGTPEDGKHRSEEEEEEDEDGDEAMSSDDDDVGGGDITNPLNYAWKVLKRVHRPPSHAVLSPSSPCTGTRMTSALRRAGGENPGAGTAEPAERDAVSHFRAKSEPAERKRSGRDA
eukprot:449388-Rhodomonas_salina.1